VIFKPSAAHVVVLFRYSPVDEFIGSMFPPVCEPPVCEGQTRETGSNANDVNLVRAECWLFKHRYPICGKRGRGIRAIAKPARICAIHVCFHVERTLIDV
jgi:hypothetical protein